MASDGSSPSPVSTWELLLALGFVEDQSVITDSLPGLSLDFGNLKLVATLVTNRRLVPVVLLGGLLTTRKSVALVEQEMPREVESYEVGVAFIVYALDNATEDKTFTPLVPAPWIAEGRRHRHLLPWERKMAAYAARPRCSVEREWARLALTTVSKQLTAVHDSSPVVLFFDGAVLTIRCAGDVCAMSAKGSAWPHSYSVRADALRTLPTRLMHPSVEFSVFDSAITIGSRRYEIMYYSVLTGDNSHAYDESEVDDSGSFVTPEEAVAAAKEIVDRSLRWERRQCTDPTDPAELYDRYVDFGDSPVIRPDVEPRFSALSYAKARSVDICKEPFRKDAQ